jgi:hypothetical protein
LPFGQATAIGIALRTIVRFKYIWKSIISRLVGEVSLTGFLFVYASLRRFGKEDACLTSSATG